MELRNHTVLITGGTCGIGLELARRLLERGNTVAVTGRDRKKIEEARAASPALHVYESDVSDPLAIRALHEQVVAELPTLDVLVNNAGIMRNLNLNEERSLDDVTKELEILLRGPMQMVQQFLPHLRMRSEALIVNVSSGLAFIPFPISPVYSAAKAGLHAYTLCLRAQLAGSRVNVVELAPPGTETALFRREFAKEVKGQKAMSTEKLVTIAIAGIERGKTEIRPGQANALKALSRLAPNLIFKQMVKMTMPHGMLSRLILQGEVAEPPR